MHFLPQKISGNDVHENYRPNELEYYSQNLILVDNDNDDSLANLVQPRPGKRPKRPPLPVRKEDYSEYFQYFTVKTPEDKTPSVPEDSDERIISSSLVRETSSVRRRKKRVRRRRPRRNIEENIENDAEYYQPYEENQPEEKSSENEFDYEAIVKVTGKSSNDSNDDSEDESQIDVESDYSPIGRLNDFHHCKDQFSDEYPTVPMENYPANRPRKNLTDTLSQLFEKSKNLRNLRANISTLGIYAQPKAWF